MKTPAERKAVVLAIRKYAIVLLMLSLCIGCTHANSGRLKLSSEVGRLFESHQVLEDHNYYFSGSDVRPNAIMGIQKDYHLKSRLWKSENVTPERLKLWINLMTDYRGFSIRTYGSWILDPNGKAVGIWYSPWQFTPIWFEPDNMIIVGTPQVNEFERPRRLFKERDI
jgi:hypothetical protein